MPIRFDIPTQALYSDLLDRLKTLSLEQYRYAGSFIAKTVKGRRYWYHVQKVGGHQTHSYVGPDTAEVQALIMRDRPVIEAVRDQLTRNRRTVRMLAEAGYSRPDALTGRLLARLADAGAFRLRAVLVGTHAFRAYEGLLGVKLPVGAGVTGDVDLAQFRTVSVAVDDQIDQPIETLLKGIDDRFTPVPRLDRREGAAEWRLPNGDLTVELLCPLVGPDDDALQALPALQGRGKPLRYLDYLIYETESVAILHDAGVLARVPLPSRYACHKLIVSQVRTDIRLGNSSKVVKDIQQAESLLKVLLQDRRGELEDSWRELLDRGPRWRRHAGNALQGLNEPLAAEMRRLAGAALG